MSLDLKKSAVVTGGGTGIGRAVAEELVRAGYDVVITGRRRAVLDETAARIGATAVCFDATDPAQVGAAFSELPASVDVLVNNAGGNTDIGAATPETLAGKRDSWLANYEANVVGPVLVTAALAGRLADGGRVVNVSSIAVRRGGGSYGAAKAAVETWTGQLAGELGPRGITVNAISPGFIGETEFFGDGLPDERRAALVEETATGRAGHPADIAAVVAFLASTGAGHVTGQVLPVNGGASR